VEELVEHTMLVGEVVDWAEAEATLLVQQTLVAVVPVALSIKLASMAVLVL